MLARTHIIAFALAVVVAAVATPLVRALSHKFRLYDLPDERKIHSDPIPRLGGIAIAFAFFAPVAGLLIHINVPSLQLAIHNPFLWSLFAGGGIILGLGVFDDIYGADHRLKFSVQIGIGLLVHTLGLRIEDIMVPLVGQVHLGNFSVLVTVLWIVGIVNAMNLIDGLDGLASGVSFFAIVTLFLGGVMEGDGLVCLVTACLGGAIVGFLFYNFNPASIFMGDSGSMFVGFVLAILSIASFSKSTTLVALVVPLLALGLPIFDTLFAVARRLYTKKPVFSADTGHVHHRLLARGLSHRQAVFYLYGICVLLALTALVIQIQRDFMAGGILFLCGTIIFAMMHILRFWQPDRRHERNAGLFSNNTEHRRLMDCVRKTTKKIREAEEVMDVWEALKFVAIDFKVTALRLKLHIRPSEQEGLEHELCYVQDGPLDPALEPERSVPLMDQEYIYGSLGFVGLPTEKGSYAREAYFLLLSETIVEFLIRRYGERANEVFVVQRHPGLEHHQRREEIE